MTRHYAKRPFSCWCKVWSIVRGRGVGSQSSRSDLLVTDCTCTRQTSWTEDQFTVTAAGIRDRETRVPEIVVREIKRDKHGAWGCVQAREVWSTEEETHMCPGHYWIYKFGTVPGSMNSVEKKFELQTQKWEEYKGPRYYDGDRTVVVELWLNRVADDLSGLTFQEYTPQRVLTLKCPGGNARQLERVARHGLPPHGSESSSTRHGVSRGSSNTR